MYYFLHKSEIIYKTKRKPQEGLILNRQNISCSYIGRKKQSGVVGNFLEEECKKFEDVYAENLTSLN